MTYAQNGQGPPEHAVTPNDESEKLTHITDPTRGRGCENRAPVILGETAF